MLYMSIVFPKNLNSRKPRREDTWTVMVGRLEANGRMNMRRNLIKWCDWWRDFGSSRGPYPRASLVGPGRAGMEEEKLGLDGLREVGLGALSRSSWASWLEIGPGGFGPLGGMGKQSGGGGLRR